LTVCVKRTVHQIGRDQSIAVSMMIGYVCYAKIITTLLDLYVRSLSFRQPLSYTNKIAKRLS